jgi:catechol 2,3-dioxygenase-like lactoylglutathione lyase family enzyme
MINGLQHTCIHVGDIEKSLAFYRDVLGLRLLFRSEPAPSAEFDRTLGVKGSKLKIAHLVAGKADDIELIEYVTPRGKGFDRDQQDVGNLHIAFSVDDIDKTYEELVKKGVKFVTPPNETNTGPEKGWKWCYFHDPDGVLLELTQRG